MEIVGFVVLGIVVVTATPWIVYAIKNKNK